MAKVTKEGYRKKVIGYRIFLIVLILAIAAGCYFAYQYHNKTVNEQIEKYKVEQEQKKLLEERIKQINGDLDASNEEKNTLLKKIEALVAEDVYYFDSAMIKEEVKQIGELATVEYRYTNVGTLDATKKVFKKFKLPSSQKTAVVTMDGVLKVGIDVKKIDISSDENTKVITISLPPAKILSNELDETSLKVYQEKEGIFSNISIEDTSDIRQQIKDKSKENAEANGVFERATDNSEQLIRCMLESIPGLKETYTIQFK